MLLNLGSKSETVDPRVDSLIDSHQNTVKEIALTDEWVAEVEAAVSKLNDSQLTMQKQMQQLFDEHDIDAGLVRNDIDELRERMQRVEQSPAPVHHIKGYDDSSMKRLVSSLEKVAVETANHVDNLGARCEADIKQLRQDLLRIAAKVQKLEGRSPWYRIACSRLLFWRKK